MTTTPRSTEPGGRSPWPLMIALSFAIVIAMNVLFAWVAVHGRDPVVATYTTEAR